MPYSNELSQAEEKQMVSSVTRGNTYAFTKLVRQYERLVISIVYKMVSQQEDREDLCQEVFLKVYDKISSFRFESKLSTWIGNIAFNLCLNFLKKKKSFLLDDIYTPGGEEGPELSSANIKDESIHPDEQLMKKEMQAVVRAAIEELPLLQKTIVSLFHQEGLSLQEIGTIMDLPVNTVKSHLFRARKNLKTRVLDQLNR
jgi:RNA polymerase sigma-70 factor (ECF subfamily)